MARYILILSFILISRSGFAQCEKKNTTFTAGEKITYSVYYNWGFIWLNAGWVEFKVANTMYEGKEVYHLDSYGRSHKSYDWLYKVRDSYQTYLDKETLQPLWFHRKNYEGGFETNNKYFFDWNNQRAFTFTENSDNPFKADTVQLPECTQDVLSLIYYTRNLDFNHLHVNDTVPVTSIIDNEIYSLYIRYLGKETIKDKNDNIFRCQKFSALLVEGTIFKGGEDLIVWVTDDANKMPILVEAKILVGSVKAYLTKHEGLLHPLKAQLTKQ